jgi:hypothetical protein
MKKRFRNIPTQHLNSATNLISTEQQTWEQEFYFFSLR